MSSGKCRLAGEKPGSGLTFVLYVGASTTGQTLVFGAAVALTLVFPIIYLRDLRKPFCGVRL